MKATILKTGDFIREAEITRIDALKYSYNLEFSSILQTARDPESVQKNFGLILSEAMWSVMVPGAEKAI